MHHDTAKATDTASFIIETVDELPEQKEYVVLTHLHINAKHYEKGSKILLDEVTGNNFKRNGDLQDA